MRLLGVDFCGPAERPGRKRTGVERRPSCGPGAFRLGRSPEAAVRYRFVGSGVALPRLAAGRHRGAISRSGGESSGCEAIFSRVGPGEVGSRLSGAPARVMNGVLICFDAVHERGVVNYGVI